MSKEISTTLIVVLSLIGLLFFSLFVLGGYFIGSYNTFVVAKQDIDNQWSNVKTEYQRRADLITNVAEVAKGYAKFESETMVKVTQARGGNFGNNLDEEMENMNSMDSAISRLLVTFEQYPQLKTIEQYNKLTEELQRTENRIQIARTDYNALVRSYNILIMKFPRTIIANMYGYKPMKFFENNKGNDAVELNMSD